MRIKEDENMENIAEILEGVKQWESADISVRMVTALVPVWRYIYM